MRRFKWYRRLRGGYWTRWVTESTEVWVRAEFNRHENLIQFDSFREAEDYT